MKIQIRPLTVDEACELLSVLGCSADPVIVNGEETTVNDLWGGFTTLRGKPIYGNTSAARCHIYYYGGKGCKKQKGTLRSMVLDRLQPDRRNL